MKQMTCAAMGGPSTCMAVISGNTAEEMAANGTKHVMATHADMAESMKAMPQVAMDKWMVEFKPKFDAAPEMPA